MKHIIDTLEMAEKLVGQKAESPVYDIERDLLLEKVRNLYAAVLKLEVAAPAVEEEPAVAPVVELIAEPEPEMVAPEVAEAEPVVEPELAIEELEEESEPEEESVVVVEGELFSEEVFVEEPAVEEEFVEEPAIEEEAEEELVEEFVEEPAAITEESVLALYDDEDEEPVAEPEVEEPAIEEELVEVSMEDDVDFASEVEGAATVSLRRTIGINDKIILMRDLFGGNNEYYNRVISKLDSFDSLDDAMIYIHDNYHWNSKSEGARLLVELLARKLF